MRLKRGEIKMDRIELLAIQTFRIYRIKEKIERKTKPYPKKTWKGKTIAVPRRNRHNEAIWLTSKEYNLLNILKNRKRLNPREAKPNEEEFELWLNFIEAEEEQKPIEATEYSGIMDKVFEITYDKHKRVKRIKQKPMIVLDNLNTVKILRPTPIIDRINAV